MVEAEPIKESPWYEIEEAWANGDEMAEQLLKQWQKYMESLEEGHFVITFLGEDSK